MIGQHQSEEVLTFDSLSVNLANGTLLRDGVPVSIEPKPFRILVVLLRQPGQVVTHEEFRAELWPDVTVEVGDNLMTQVNKLRKALGESRQNARYILTRQHEGYQFNPKVLVEHKILNVRDEEQPGNDAILAHDTVVGPDEAEIGEARGSLMGPKVVRITVAAAILIACMGCYLYWLSPWKGAANSFTVEGRLLKVFDQHNQLLWDYAFPPDANLLVDTAAGRPEWTYKFLDLGGRRGTEFLFATANFLYCFDRNGKIRWKHKPGREVVDSQGDIVPANFDSRLLDVLSQPRGDGGRIIFGASRGPGALFVVEMLTADGKKVGEYFHFGWFFALAVGTLGKQGHEDIFLAGVDDASSASSPYGATLVVLDPDRVSGQAATELDNPRAALKNIAPAHEKAVLLIKEFAPNVDPSAYCRGKKITVLENSLELYVTQEYPVTRDLPAAYFLFDQKLQLQSVLPELPFQKMLQSTILKSVPAGQWQNAMKQSLGDIIYVRNEFASAK